MENKIKMKLRSEKGASITFALLLFLVCAVLCSVIITAATAASGRMAKIAENDQRYYSVTSAAELLQTLIDGQSASIVKVVREQYTTTYIDGVAGEPVSDKEPVSEIYVVSGTAFSADNLGEPITDAPEFDTIVKDVAYRIYSSSGEAFPERTYSLSSGFYNSVGLDYDAYAVTIGEKLNISRDKEDLSGNMELTIYNKYAQKNESTSGSRYTMALNFGLGKNPIAAPDVKLVEKNNNDSHVNSAGKVEYTVTTEKTTATIYTYSWTLTDIGVISN